jgi:capsular polysaccharide transport system permease protein
MSNRPDEITGDRQPMSALDRNKQATTALAVVARKLRLTTSQRGKLYASVGLRPRGIDKLMKALFIAAFALFFALPNIASGLYYGLLASDQFMSETRFTVRTSEPMQAADQFGDMSGIPSAKIVQDTQIVANYIISRTMLERLEREADFIGRYSSDQADWLARLPEGETIEERLEYWESMVDVGISPSSGIITVQVRAFSAEDARAIVQEVVAASEALINDLNDRIWNDATASARAQVERATASLSQARQAFETARNESGILAVEETSTSLSALLTQLMGEKIELEGRMNAVSDNVSRDAPQMRVLAREIEAKDQQIAQLRSQIASTNGGGTTLADTSTVFSQLTLEQTIAEQQLTASITALEQLQYLSQQQLMYLDPFLAPTLPDGAEYPRRAFWSMIIFVVSLLTFGIVAGILSIVRTRLG